MDKTNSFVKSFENIELIINFSKSYYNNFECYQY